MGVTSLALLVLTAVRGLNLLVSLDLALRRRAGRYWILATGWLLYAGSTGIRLAWPDSVAAFSIYAALALVGSLLVVAGVLTYFVRLEARRVLAGAAGLLIAALALYIARPASHALTPIVQSITLLGASGYAVLRARTVMRLAGSSFFWMVGFFVIGVAQALVYVTFPDPGTGLLALSILLSFAVGLFILNLDADVTHRFLVDSRRRYLTLFESAADAVYLHTPEGAIREVNAAASEMLGYPEDELMTMTVRDLDTAPRHDDHADKVREILDGGPLLFRTEHVRKDGSVVPVEVSSRSVVLEDERLVFSVVRDVTARIRAEGVLRKKTRELEAFFDVSLDLLLVVDAAGAILKASPSWEQALGYDPDALVGTLFQSYVYAEDRERTEEVLRELADGAGVVGGFVNRWVGRDGGARSIEWRVVRSGPGGVIYASARDVTERLRAEQELRSSRELLEQAELLAGSGSWRMDLETGEVTGSSGLRKILGVSPDARLEAGELVDSLLVGEHRESAHAAMRRLLESGERTPLEVRVSDDGDGERYLRVEGEAILDETGRPRTAVGFVRDITEHKRAELELEGHRARLESIVQDRETQLAGANDELAGLSEELIEMNRHLSVANRELERTNRELDEANEELQCLNEELESSNEELISANVALEEADAAKSSFLAQMSHELRTPLNAIIGFSGVLASGSPGDLNPEQERQIEMIETSGRHLLGLIEQLLDLSRIEESRITLDLERFDVVPLATSALDTVRGLASSSGLSLEADLPETPLHVCGDRLRIRQVLLNLLSNAIKYTHEGVVALDLVPDGDEMRFEVSDTGPGVPPEMRERVFEPFAQVHPDAERAGGLGLGLAVSRGLAEAMGGSLELRSTLGEGSTFVLRLPLDVPSSD